MSRSMSPAKKDIDSLEKLLAKGPVRSTGGLGRLHGKIASQLAVSIGAVPVLIQKAGAIVHCKDGLWEVKLPNRA